MLSGIGRVELEKLARKSGSTCLLLWAGYAGDAFFFHLKGAPRVIELDVGTQTMNNLLEVTD